MNEKLVVVHPPEHGRLTVVVSGFIQNATGVVEKALVVVTVIVDPEGPEQEFGSSGPSVHEFEFTPLPTMPVRPTVMENGVPSV